MLRILTIAGAFALAGPAIAQDTPQPGPPEQSTPEKDVGAAVAADWPKFDHGGKGHLTQDEFGTWLTTLRAQSSGANEDPAKVKAWADTSFAKADADSNRQVSPEEFTAFLQSKIKK